jgi:NAD(P)-dependent dehydrogenase (short-subunit alcohol dehydrogenase family)
MMDFTGKRVLITGASRGIGRECAVQFAKHGARVAVHYNRNESAAQETLASLAGEGHMIVQADVSDAQSVKAMVDAVVNALGGVDVLVNNAGIYEEHPIADVDYDESLDQWARTIQTNLIGAANA